MKDRLSATDARKTAALAIVSGATMLALVVFTVPLTTLAPSGQVLASARIAQGLGSAAVLACGLGLLAALVLMAWWSPSRAAD